MLNIALGTQIHRREWYKDLNIRFWERQDRFPPNLLKFKEGSTEPDIIIEFENPPTTIFIEAKYTSPLASGTTYSDQNDQVLRGIRTLLAATGHVQADGLFNIPPRNPIWLALLAYRPESLVDRYKNQEVLAENLKGMLDEQNLPNKPFIGTITWLDITTVLVDRCARAIVKSSG